MDISPDSPPDPSAPVTAEEVAGLILQHRTELYAFLFAAIGNHHDAEDLLQEVSVAATRSAASFRRGTNFRAWAREIARRRVLEFVRARPGRQFIFADPLILERLADAANSLDDAEPDRLRGEVVRNCLGKLGGIAQRVMELKYAECQDAESIAAQLHRSATAVYSILKRTRELVRRCADQRISELRACDEI